MLTIGALSAATGVKIPTIRYYEDTGLLPEASRTAAGRRSYEPAMVARLRFIRHARELGFAPEAIRDLLSLATQREGDCSAADAIARAQLNAVRSRLARLEALQAELSRMLEGPHTSLADCRVLDVLSDHALCTRHESDSNTDLRHPL